MRTITKKYRITIWPVTILIVIIRIKVLISRLIFYEFAYLQLLLSSVEIKIRYFLKLIGRVIVL